VITHTILPTGQTTLIFPNDFCCAGCILSARPCRIPCKIIAALAHHKDDPPSPAYPTQKKTATAIRDINIFQNSPHGADAALLHLVLRSANHHARPFAVSPTAMARQQTIKGWSHHRYRRARAFLEHHNILQHVHQGGNGQHDRNLYRLTEHIPNEIRQPPTCE
jgi:hypothetical protein